MKSIQAEVSGQFHFPKAVDFEPKVEVIKQAVVETVQPVVILTQKAESKADKAKVVFMDCYKNYHLDQKSVPARKDIINRLITECGLTQNGAATYLQNMKTKAGLVVKK